VSLLASSSSVHSSALRPDEHDDASRAWAHDPAGPHAVDLDQHPDAAVDPDGLPCRSFRAASYHLRGLAMLDADLPAITGYLGSRADGSTGHPDVG
jgi:hypothetical protein